MADFKTLNDEILGLTSQAARFRKVILHLHSPESCDFGDVPGSDSILNNKSQYLANDGEKLFLSHIGNSVDMISITDHMRSSFACRISSWAIDNQHYVKILPGIELNIRLQAPFNSLRIHVVVIFPESKSLGEIERIFPDSDIPSDERRTGKEELDIPDLPKFIKDIREKHQGICIAAHVDHKNGIRMLFRQTGKETICLFNPDGKLSKEDEREISDSFKDFLAHVYFDGIEITKPEDRKHYTWQSAEGETTHHVPVFLTFDAHNVEALKALKEDNKDKITYVKMAEISWQGLRDAIQFPLTRIRFSDDRVPPPYIIGMQIISGSGQGFFSDLKLGFVGNLNCLIGARGSGKSTVIDAIRYIFGYNRTLDELGSPDLKKAVKDRQKATLKESIIRVAYQVTEREIHFLEAVYGGDKADYVTKVYDVNGEVIHVDDVEKNGKYPLRLFGWSEIETLGRDPERQLDLLDKLVEGIKELKDERDDLRSKLRENTKIIIGQAQTLLEIYQRNDKEIKKYNEYKDEFDRYNTKEVETLFENLDNVRARRELLREFARSISLFESTLQGIMPIEFEKRLQDDFDKNPALKVWWDSIKDIELNLTNSQSSIRTNLNTVSSAISALFLLIDKLATRLDEQVNSLNGQIRNNVSVDPEKQVLADLRTQVKERLEKVENLREEYNEEYVQMDSLLSIREKIISHLTLTQAKVTQHRHAKNNDIEEKLNEFQTDDMKVEIHLVQDGNNSKLETKLQKLEYLGEAHRNYKSKKWPEVLANKLIPVLFTRSILEADFDKLIAHQVIGGVEYSITSDEAQTICGCLIPFKDDLSALVKEINIEKLEALLEIDELEWDDKVSILRNGQPVENASPGQRSSAMLPLIALAETVPLVIDQPEDNLDNRLVGKVLVDILAKLKEKRQIIVCTHNPNIVVLGDAEQVIVLDAIDNTHGRAENIQASIDHPFIIKRVIELMEGGRDAFETRRKRYG